MTNDAYLKVDLKKLIKDVRARVRACIGDGVPFMVSTSEAQDLCDAADDLLEFRLIVREAIRDYRGHVNDLHGVTHALLVRSSAERVKQLLADAAVESVVEDKAEQTMREDEEFLEEMLRRPEVWEPDDATLAAHALAAVARVTTPDGRIDTQLMNKELKRLQENLKRRRAQAPEPATYEEMISVCFKDVCTRNGEQGFHSASPSEVTNEMHRRGWLSQADTVIDIADLMRTLRAQGRL